MPWLIHICGVRTYIQKTTVNTRDILRQCQGYACMYTRHVSFIFVGYTCENRQRRYAWHIMSITCKNRQRYIHAKTDRDDTRDISCHRLCLFLHVFLRTETDDTRDISCQFQVYVCIYAMTHSYLRGICIHTERDWWYVWHIMSMSRMSMYVSLIFEGYIYTYREILMICVTYHVNVKDEYVNSPWLIDIWGVYTYMQRETDDMRDISRQCQGYIRIYAMSHSYLGYIYIHTERDWWYVWHITSIRSYHTHQHVDAFIHLPHSYQQEWLVRMKHSVIYWIYTC